MNSREGKQIIQDISSLHERLPMAQSTSRTNADPMEVSFSTPNWLSCLIPQNKIPESTGYSEVAVQLRMVDGKRCSVWHAPNLGLVTTRLQQHNIWFPRELVDYAADNGAPPRAVFGPWCLSHLTSS